MILPIVAYGAGILRERCKDVNIVPDQLIRNMWDTMYNAEGCGLAAPQVNIPLRIFIIEDKEAGIRECFINAQIIDYSADQEEDEEGCLSIPGLSAPVKPAVSISISYVNANFERQERTFTGTTARIIQHEYDHIEGWLYTDLLSPLQRSLWKYKLKNIKKAKYPMIIK